MRLEETVAEGGGADVVSALFETHFTPLLRAMYFVLGNRQDAEEVVQEAFVRLLASRRRLRAPERAGGYLRATAVNLARDRLRRLDVGRRAAPRLRAVDADLPAETMAMAGEDRRSVVAALALLPPRQRECLVLRYYLDLSEAEIADAMGIARGSVKAHASRGLAALGELLEGVR